MNRFAIIGVALAFAGCDDITLDNGTKSGDTADCTTDPPKNVTIQEVDITCDTTTSVTFTVSVDGVAADGTFYAQETGNTTPQYSDNHDLMEGEVDACGLTSTLTQNLTTDVAFGTDTPNTSTVFSCAADTHYAADVMTYAVHVFDDMGNLLDCAVGGNNPSDVIGGVSERVNEPTEDVTGCATLSGAAY